MILRTLLYFITYSFLGWILDTSFRSIIAGEFAPNAVTWLPFTPIYGFGALLILAIHSKIKPYPVWVWFFVYSVVLTAFEYLGGVFTVAFLGKRLWDYSNIPFNIDGHVNLAHAIAWGLLAIILVKWVHPRIKALCDKSSSEKE